MRTIANTGQPFTLPDGTPLVVNMKFCLVDADNSPVNAFDLNSKEHVLNTIEASTDAAGEFSVSLAPNDELSGDTYYRVTIDDALGFRPFRAKLLSGSGAVSFYDFYTGGQTLSTGEVSNLAAHVQDDTRHLTASEDAALSAANSPSGGNPLATMNDVGGGTFAALADTPSSYTSQAGKYPRVKSTEDGLEYVSGVGSGEANTASNVGAGGVGLFKQKVAEDLQFKNINAGSGRVAVTDDTANSEVDIDVVEANLVHDNLSGAGTNTHAQIDSHIGSTANPHSVTAAQAGAAPASHVSDTSNPHSVTKAQVGLSNVSNTKNNTAATAAPTVNDDSGAGYSVGSLWADTTNDRAYICLDASAGAAVWKEITMAGRLRIDEWHTFTVNTHDPSTGAATDADAAPTYRIYEDETGTPILTGTMTLLDGANTAGFYSERIQLTAAAGFEEGKSYNIYIEAAVGGVTGTTRRSFQM